MNKDFFLIVHKFLASPSLFPRSYFGRGYCLRVLYLLIVLREISLPSERQRKTDEDASPEFPRETNLLNSGATSFSCQSSIASHSTPLFSSPSTSTLSLLERTTTVFPLYFLRENAVDTNPVIINSSPLYLLSKQFNWTFRPFSNSDI